LIFANAANANNGALFSLSESAVILDE